MGVAWQMEQEDRFHQMRNAKSKFVVGFVSACDSQHMGRNLSERYPHMI